VTVLYTDEFFFTLQFPLKRVWTREKKPRLPRLRKKGPKNRMALFAGISLESEVHVQPARVANTETFWKWIEHLKAEYSTSTVIYLILDHASYHTLGFRPETGVEEPPPRVKLVGVPAYSPELNLAEQLGRSIKRELSYIYFTQIEEVMEEVQRYEGQRRPGLVQKVAALGA